MHKHNDYSGGREFSTDVRQWVERTCPYHGTGLCVVFSSEGKLPSADLYFLGHKSVLSVMIDFESVCGITENVFRFVTIILRGDWRKL